VAARKGQAQLKNVQVTSLSRNEDVTEAALCAAKHWISAAALKSKAVIDDLQRLMSEAPQRHMRQLRHDRDGIWHTSSSVS
jgi:hypothetical protein